MSEPNEPTASRRAVLQLLAGTAAYSALSGVGAKGADARGPVAALRDGVIKGCNRLQGDPELVDKRLDEHGIGGDNTLIGGQGGGRLDGV